MVGLTIDHDLKIVLEWGRIVLELLLATYAVVHGTAEVRDKFADLVGRFHKDTYRVKWTSIKDIIRDDHTEFVKLRMLRVYNDMAILSIDTAPGIVETDCQVEVSNLYSIPGRADINPEGKIDIRFSTDEHLKPFRDRVVLIGYRLNSTIKELYGIPGVQVVKPVGKERLIYEAHFPPGRRYERVAGDANRPKILVYSDPSHPLDPKKYHVGGGNFDFRDGLGLVDWLRVTIPKPPQDKDIHIKWFWQKGYAPT
jgi:hypothetical protein